MGERRGIIAGGNWIVDHVKVIDAWPPQDALANIVSETKGNGGSPYNLLKNLAKLDARIPLEGIGLVGEDADGRHILSDCEFHGIKTAQLKSTARAATAYTDVMTVRGSGRRTFFHSRGANALLAAEDFDFTGSQARHFHLGYALLLDALDQTDAKGIPRMGEVLARARRAGLTTSLDCVSEHSDRFRSVITPVLPEVDVLFVNDFEAEKLTGIVLGRGRQIARTAVEAAARRMLGLGVRQQVVIHFPAGAFACRPGGQSAWCPALSIPAGSMAGSAGAGDALASGLLLGLHEDWPMEKCLALAVCAAAACLTEVTCSAGVRSVAECLELARRWGYQELSCIGATDS
jgi:sugar/nucleoside kinase (ribokinase family)